MRRIIIIYACLLASCWWISAQTTSDMPVQDLPLEVMSLNRLDFGIPYQSPDSANSESIPSNWEPIPYNEVYHSIEDAYSRYLNGGMYVVEDEYDRYDVGQIPYQETITPYGGRGYSVPIMVSPTSKFPPQISFQYNSQSGNGLAGFGWSIGGLSTITISNKNLYYHNIVAPADANDSEAVFSLDGVPLVPNDDPALSDEYPLETAHGHILVKTHMFGDKVRYFTVLYPDGSKAIFGEKDDLSQQAVYPITLWEDIFGNVIEYEYYSNSPNYRISDIRFKHKNNDEYEGSLSFEYSSRSDYLNTYFAGEYSTQDQLLKTVTSISNGDTLCTYNLSHQFKSEVNLLTSIECTNPSNKGLRPLQFSYGNLDNYGETFNHDIYLNTNIFLSSYFPSSSDIKLEYHRGKMLANNYKDGLVILPHFENYGPIKRELQWLTFRYQYGSTYSDDQDILVAPNLSSSGSVYTIKAGSDFQTISIVDVDGDGTDEIVRVNFGNISIDNKRTVLRIQIYGASNSGISVKDSFGIEVDGTYSDNGYFISPSQRCYFFGDFKGDGETQLLSISFDEAEYYTTGESHFALIDLDSGSIITDTSLFSLSWNEYANGKVICVDMDGDGRTELCHLSDNTLYIYNLIGDNFTLTKTITSSSSLLSPLSHLTDINGDGYIDVAIEPEDVTSYWRLYFYTGYGFIQKETTIRYKGVYDKFLFIDINNDGLPDLIQSNNMGTFYHLNENGNYNYNNRIKSSITLPLDVNIVPYSSLGYNTMSDFITVEGAYVNVYGFTQDLQKERLLTKFSNSLGIVTINNYADMAVSDAVYQHDDSQVYSKYLGYSKRRFPLQLLYSTQTYLNQAFSTSSLLKNEFYTYFDACTHSRGLGFLGFRKVYTVNYLTAPDEEIISIETRNPEKMGVPIRATRSINSSNASPFEETVYWYDDNSTIYGKLNPRLIKSETTDFLSGVTTVSEMTYDDYDFPTSTIVTKILDEVETHVEKSDVKYEHNHSGDRYVLGVVKESSVTKTSADTLSGDPWREKSIYTYDELYHPLTRKDYVIDYGLVPTPVPDSSLTVISTYGRFPINSPIIKIDTARLVSETRWEYDNRGNIISETSAPHGISTFTGSSYTYDSLGRYLVASTNALGHTTTYSGYNKFGKPASVTDHMGRTTSYTYDSWGNLTRTEYPDGSTEEVTLAWGGNGLYTTTVTATNAPVSITHHDRLGREIRKGNLCFDGQWQFVDKVYDNKGRLLKESLPFFGDIAQYWNVIGYDTFDRRTSLTEPSGKTSTWAYDGTSTTSCQNGIVSTKTYDANGNLASVSDAGGTITYTLRNDGQPSKVTTPDGVVTRFSYDGYGRRTRIEDPSAGEQTETFKYNSDGSSVSTHTNPNGTLTTYMDKFGRTTKIERLGEYNTEYSYDSRGLLVQETSTNGTSKIYTYDNFDRVSTEKEIIPDGNWLQKTYTYLSGNNVSSIEYLSSNGYITTEHFTYQNGTCTRIDASGIPVRIINSENEFGQPTSVTTGGITRTYSYNAYGMPTRRTMGAVMDYSYSFDPLKGNLMSRTDNLRNQTETFGYDALNRLTVIDEREITYSDNGNITSIDSVGDMTYDNSAKPYQVTSLTLEEDVVPSRVQNVTYTCYSRPSIMTEGGRSAAFTYNGDGARVKMNVSDGATSVLSRYYIGNQYELDVTPNGTTERLYLGGDAYSAPAVYVKEGSGAWTFYNIGRDYLGNITHIATADGTLVEENSYDPWGRLRNPETREIYSLGTEPELMLGRGYTGHEHLTWFGLINMNARLYDPVLGRFLSPDPFVQMPDFTQNFNRYSYCLNNPLIFVDKSGEYFVVDSFLVGLLGGGWDRAVKMAENDLKIWGGLFATDGNKNILGRAWEFISRFTWQSPQTLGGFITAHTFNTCRLYKGVESVSYLYGATVVRTNGNDFGAITQSSFIVGDCNIEANPSDELFQHEYGHYLQSQDIGPLYYLTIGIPSFISAIFNSYDDHNRTIMEQDCNIRAFKYFNKNVSSFTYMDENGKINSSWNFASNPILGYDGSQMPDSEHNKSVLRNRISWDIRVNREINGVEPSVLMEPSLDTFYHVVL